MTTAPTRERTSESDLSRAIDQAARCTTVRPLQGNLFEISFQAPELARRARPGEFAQIWVEPSPIPLLRRPFSFSRADPQAGVVSFYVGAVGEGSRRLRRFSPGQGARILGPLGRGFSLPERAGTSLLVSGGLGAAPFPLLAERLLAREEELVWVNGARTASELYPDDLIPAGIGEVIQYTEDGSSGERGRVTAGVGALLASADRVYACGPNRMLAALFSVVAGAPARPGSGPDLEVSVEAPMGCGFGTCLGCAIPLRLDQSPGAGFGLCCRQGPVLRGSWLDWERLLLQPAHLS